MALTEQQLVEYQQLLTEVNRMAQEDLVALWRSLEHLDRDALWSALQSGVPEIVSMYRSISTDTAMLFYSETQGLEFSRAEALTAVPLNSRQLEANLRWAMFNPGNTEILGLVSGIVQKHVVDGSRSYALGAFSRDNVGWHRAARPEACNFCRMLATRSVTGGGAYGSAEAAVFAGRGRHSRKSGTVATGGEFHQNCMCIPVKSTEYEPPSYVEKWANDYQSAVNAAGGASNAKEVLAAMRTVSGHSH